jgi:hypothetical protein
MKRYHHGPGHGISTQSLAFTEVAVSGEEDDADRLTTLLSVEARICFKPMSLCLRIQQWALIGSARREMILAKTKFVRICRHMSVRSPEVSRLIESELKSGGRAESDCRVHADVFKCRHCNMEFQVEIRALGNEGLALVITKWLDLGSELTPRDIRWGTHLHRLKDEEIGLLGEAGDTRLRFEIESGLSQDELACRNASYLIANRFIEEMDVGGHKLWFLQAGERLPFYFSRRTFFLALALSELSLVWLVWEIYLRTK